jgi:hypothetical protein
MHPVWAVTAFLVAILIPAFWFGLNRFDKLAKNENRAGSGEARAKRLWDHTPSHQRDLMLASILIFDSPYRDGLLTTQWKDLPFEVRSPVVETLAGIRVEGEMYIGYVDQANRLVSVPSQAGNAGSMDLEPIAEEPGVPRFSSDGAMRDRVLTEAA